MGSSTKRNSVSSFMVQYDKGQKHYIGWCNTAIGHSTSWFQIHERSKTWLLFEYVWNGCWSERKDTKRRPESINLYSGGFDICFDYDSFSNKSIVTHRVSIKMEGSDLSMRMGFKENEILRGSVPIVSLSMTHMKRYRDIQNQLVGDVRTSLLRVVTVKSIYGDHKCVTCEKPQSLPLSRSNIQSIEI